MRLARGCSWADWGYEGAFAPEVTGLLGRYLRNLCCAVTPTQATGSRASSVRASRQKLIVLAAVVAGVAAVCVEPTAATAVTTVDRHIVFQADNSGNFGLYEANSDGSNPVPLQVRALWPPSLSPDGRSVAYTDGVALYVDDISDAWNGHPRTVYSVGPGYGLRSPRFSPDGTKLVFTETVPYYDSVSEQWFWAYHLETIDTDGSNLTTVATNANEWAEPDFSPDGSKIAYASNPNPALSADNQVVVVNSDGTGPRPLTDFSSGWAMEPRFSPDGTKIAFIYENAADWSTDVWTINVDGSDLQQITHDGDADQPEWTPDGSAIVYDRDNFDGNYDIALYKTPSDGSGTELQFEGPTTGFDYASGVSFSPVGSSSFVSNDQYLASTFEPMLMFDSSEQWRPLNVDQFMQEPDPNNPGHSYNQLCAPHGTAGGCSDVPADWLDALRGDPNGYLQTGSLPGQTYPTSPYPGCYPNGSTGTIKECDSGPSTAIYDHVSPSTSVGTSPNGYNYVDYWMFYRYNQDQNDPGAGDDHQGDWEGITIAPSFISPLSFDFAIYAQHGDFSIYLPGELTCDQDISCGSTGATTGQRAWDYIATGTHASYPDYDNGDLGDICLQAQEPLPEGCHDGKAPWGANYDPTDLLQFPDALGGWTTNPSTANWVDWPGQWGADTAGFLGLGPSPSSPGRQLRFGCPGTTAPSPTACADRVGRARASQATDAEASVCRNWFGSMMEVVACSPSELASAVRTASVSNRATFRFAVGRLSARSARGRGVAQTLSAPMVAGQTIRLVGAAPRDTELFARASAHGRLFEAEFTNLGLTGGGTGSLASHASRHGIQLIWMTPNGHAVNPIWTTSRKLPKATRAQHRTARQAQAEPPTRSTTIHAPTFERATIAACRIAALRTFTYRLLRARHLTAPPAGATSAVNPILQLVPRFRC